jgi:nitroreductase
MTHAKDALGATGVSQDLIELAENLIQTRQHIGPKHLTEPGPSRDLLLRLLEAAAAAPDHAQLRPWRFVAFGEQSRDKLAAAFADALLERDATALPEQLEDARQKAYRSPTLLLAVARLAPHNPDVADAEKLISLGCAVQNLMLSALAHGFATGLTSGKALTSQAFRQICGLTEGELAVCFVNIGTTRKSRPRKIRPAPLDFVSWL